MVLAFAGFACEREAVLDFQDFDKNEDKVITEDEFSDVFAANYYEDWNSEDDEYLDDEDFYNKTYQMWDTDDNNRLSKEEWTFGYDNYFGDYVVTDYSAIDVDQDGFIEYNEFNNEMYGGKFYPSWDLDKSMDLNEEELSQGVFKHWDLDNNGTIENDEFNKFDTYFLDI